MKMIEPIARIEIRPILIMELKTLLTRSGLNHFALYLSIDLIHHIEVISPQL